MNTPPKLVERIENLIRARNRELAIDASLKALLGVVFSLVTFGMMFWIGWFFGFFLGWHVNLYPWQFGAIFTAIFLIAATWSAWRRVDPLAGLTPLSDAEKMLRLIGQTTGTFAYFSPRHASAGFAFVLIGGPANLFHAFGIWAHRVRTDPAITDAAAQIVVACQTEVPAEQIRDPMAALLLRRLALIKVIKRGTSAVVTLTDRGFAILSSGKSGRRKKSGDQAAT